jgi:hypothetical protein
MADFEFRFGRYVSDPYGWADIFKSPEMQELLTDAAIDLAEEAESVARVHGTDKKPVYEPEMDVLDNTAVADVTTGDYLAMVDNAYHHTLNAINH